MQTRLNTKVPNENLYHPGPSWHRQQLQMSPWPSSEGHLQVHTPLPNPCLVEFEECSDVQATPSTVTVSWSPKLFCWKCPKPVKNVPWDWVDYSSPPSSLLFLSLSRGTGQLRLTTLRHVRTQPGQEGKWIICSGRSGLQDSYLEKKNHAHLQELGGGKKSWPSQVLPNKISSGSGARLVSYSSWSSWQKRNKNQPI